MPRLSVNEENLLNLLTTKLYSTDPELTIRELLQNASDAIDEVSGSTHHSINIEINNLGADRWIAVSDTGIGMDESDLRHKLAVIADGDKLKRAQKIGEGKIAGRFGIGFLSTLIISDRVEVLTKKQDEQRSWRFVLERSGEYDISETNEYVERGTKVILHLGDNRDRNRELLDKISDLMTQEGMVHAIREWGYLLRYPIYLKAGGASGRQHVNARAMPWADDQAAEAAFQDLFAGASSGPPLFTYRFEDKIQDGVTFNGVFYFNDGVLYDPGARLYSSGLLVDAHSSQLIPDYAPFLQCIVDCSQINIDLARRNPEKDNTHRALALGLSRQFTSAFLQFAQRQTDAMAKLWASTDNTVTARLLHLIENSSPRLSAKRDAAIDFLIQTCQDIPFQILDEISGGQGRPVWKTIRELITAKRNDVDSKYRPDDVLDIRYTESRVPVEKDILVNEHKVLIDVGREGKNYASLIRMFGRYNDEIRALHKFQVVPTVLPPADTVSPEQLRDLWEPTTRLIQTSVNFYKREHEVVVERIRPDDTPIIVGLEDVDDDLVAALRQQLADIGMAGPQMASVIGKLDQVLNTVGGSRIRIRVNADNPTMRQLAHAALEDATARDAEIALRTITWRAVLDYFGVSATRDMISQERANVNLLVTTLLNRAERLFEAQGVESELRAKVRTLEAAVPQVVEPRPPRKCLIGIIDITRSTGIIFGNAAVGPEQKAKALSTLVDHIAGVLEEFADVNSFTGDGVQFVVRDGLSKDALIQAGVSLKSLPQSLATLVNADGELRDVFHTHGVGTPRIRIAMDHGDVYEGHIGKVVESFGLPFIRATRLVSNDAAFTQADTLLLLTRWAYEAAAESGLFRSSDFKEASPLRISGIEPSEFECYAPKND